MSDPRKKFICVKCGNPVSDKWGSQTPCEYCQRKEYFEKENKKVEIKRGER